MEGASNEKVATFTFSYDGDYAPTGENTAKLNSDEVKFFVADDNDPTAYTAAMESATDHDKVSVKVNELVKDTNSDTHADALKGTSDKITVGYLAVRIEGTTRDHTNTLTYSTSIKCANPSDFTI